jgi:glucosylceramidase
LQELFGTGEGQISISFLRLSIGSSDLDPSVFSYNDLAEGQSDIDQTKFSLDHDKTNLIPLLKEILAISPKLKIMSAPWSPPAWMKDNHNSKGGTLKPELYDSYALYFVKYIKGMQREGINIYAITPQN